MHRKPVLLVAICLALFATAAVAQFKPFKPNPAEVAKGKVPPPADGPDALITDSGAVISLDVQVVNVFASVRDKNGRYINSPTQDDFVLKENGKAQDV